MPAADLFFDTDLTMSSPSPISQSSGPLPQYGFGSEFTFAQLVHHNPFLFRVYTPKARSSAEPYFIAQKFDEKYTNSSESLPKSYLQSLGNVSPTTTYDDVVNHMNWTTRTSSPLISTSFSFVWALFEAVRRYRANVKHDIEIAIIDASAVADRSVTALELLRTSSPKQRHQDYWKWYKFALEAQDVLVYGCIPEAAVLSSIPLLSLIDKLPSYFLESNLPDQKDLHLGRLAWDYSARKPSYHRFCKSISERFSHMPRELQHRDITAGSVRLAVAFLRPWFHALILDDFPKATSKVYDLSILMAHWPAQQWIQERGEIWDIIRATVNVLGEEVRAKERARSSAEVKRLQVMVGDLEAAARSHRDQMARKHALLAKQYDEESISSGTLSHRDEDIYTDEDLTLNIGDLTMQSDEKTLVCAATDTVDLEEPSGHSCDPSLQTNDEASFPPDLPTTTSTRTHLLVGTASCIVTGFLFGAFITLCMMSSQRRVLATHLT